MPDLNGQQFAKYSSIEVPDKVYETRTEPLPASMERHAPGEYQPTLPGMEKMLKGEQTHTSVFFKHPNLVDPETAEIPGSNWWHRNRNFYPDEVKVRTSSLHPVQDWVNDNYLHSEPHPNTVQRQGLKPKVERVGRKNVVQDGHHRAVREIMAGKKSIDVERWGTDA